MPIGYLVGVLVVAVPTLFALVPQRSVPNLSFRLGLLINELPILGCYWLVFDTALALAQGDVTTAGAHMAALAALTPNDPAFQPGFEDADTSVTAAIGLNGWYGGYYGQDDASSPLRHVRPPSQARSVSPRRQARPWAGRWPVPGPG
jgi:hypothetical protein